MRTRTAEMLLASVMFSTGMTFALPGDTTSFPHFAVLADWIAVFPGTETRFGILICLAGMLRWVALIINGYYRRTPVVRIVGCVIGSALWVTLAITVLDAPSVGALSLIPGFMICFAVFETFCALRATKDAVHMGAFSRSPAIRGPHRVGGHE